jgi:hypothetical protein
MIRTTIRPRRGAGFTLAIAIAAALALPSAVVAHGPDPVFGGGLFGQDQALTFDWRSNAVPPDAIKSAIKAAAADVAASKASRAATFTWKAGGANPIGYGLGAPCGVNGIACFTRNAPGGFTMWFREQGHVFDWGAMKWCQTYDQPPNGCYDAETVALDEFGHVEGLDHHVNESDDSDYLDAVVQTFSHAKPAIGWNMHRFGVCDVATLQREYDVPSTTTKLSSCLDIATTLTLGASPAVVAAGATTTLTATLKVGSSSAYDRLKGNPLSGRIVSLQRRLTGITTWTTVGTMAAGSGSGVYALGHKPASATEYRAVFKTPTDEGLIGSTSAIVTVTVSGCVGGACPAIVQPAARKAAR